MGGAQVVVLLAGLVRAKVVALTIGAAGVGLIGIFNAFTGNISAFAGWGLGTSGVRLIAEAPEPEKPAKVAAVRRLGWLLSMVGLAIGLMAFWPSTWATFASNEYLDEMGIIAMSVPLLIASGVWAALLQASGKIKLLAKVQVAGALTGLLVGLPAVYFWGATGIALGVLLSAAVTAAVLWRAARKECPAQEEVEVALADIRQLLAMGGALMAISWLGQLSAYAVRFVIIRQEGLEAAGFYQAAFGISGSLPSFIFAAMGADFFPRISGAKTPSEAQDQLEKQIKAGLLLGVPLIGILLTSGKPCLEWMYAESFAPASPLLDWMSWGVFLRLISWPMGFWLIAKGTPRSLIAVECMGNCLAVLLPVVMLPVFGLVGAAMAFFWASLGHLAILVIVYKCRTGCWLGAGVLAWAALAGTSLSASSYWASICEDPCSDATPILALGAFCAWKYRQVMKCQ